MFTTSCSSASLSSSRSSVVPGTPFSACNSVLAFPETGLSSYQLDSRDPSLVVRGFWRRGVSRYAESFPACEPSGCRGLLDGDLASCRHASDADFPYVLASYTCDPALATTASPRASCAANDLVSLSFAPLSEATLWRKRCSVFQFVLCSHTDTAHVCSRRIYRSSMT